MSSAPRKARSITTELAKERNRQAAERTFTSWIQNCLMLIAFGFTFERIVSAINASLPPHAPVPLERAAPYIALGTIGLGVLMLILAAAMYRNEIAAVEKFGGRYAASRRLSVLATAAITAFGLIALLAVFIKSG